MGQIIFDDESIYEISKFHHAWFLRYALRDEWTNARTHGLTIQKQYAPQLLRSLGHKIVIECLCKVYIYIS